MNERVFYPQIIHTGLERCSCSYDQQIQHFVVISAKHSNTGKYFLKAVVSYGNENINTYKTALRYSVEEKGSVSI